MVRMNELVVCFGVDDGLIPYAAEGNEGKVSMEITNNTSLRHIRATRFITRTMGNPSRRFMFKNFSVDCVCMIVDICFIVKNSISKSLRPQSSIY